MALQVFIRAKPDRQHLLLYYVDPLTKREVSRSSGTADRKEAERAAARWEQELIAFRGEHDDGWAYFRQRFEDEHVAALARKTQFGFGTALNHFERLVKVARVSDVTPGILSTFQAALRRENKSPASVVNYLTHLRAALNWAEGLGMIPKAPKISLPRSNKRKFMRGRPITEPEYQAMLAACTEPAYYRFMELLWLSGLRLGEAARLSWDSPPIRAWLDAKPYPQIVFFGEGHKSRQDDATPMTPDLAAWLAKTPPDERRGVVAAVPLATVDRISDAIRAYGEAAKIVVNEHGKFASAHDFRRAFGTRWAAVVRPLTLQRMMRHANIETTLKYYVGLSSADAGAELWSGHGNTAAQ